MFVKEQTDLRGAPSVPVPVTAVYFTLLVRVPGVHHACHACAHSAWHRHWRTYPTMSPLKELCCHTDSRGLSDRRSDKQAGMNPNLARRHALLPLQVLDGVRLVSLLQVQAIMALCITFMEVRRPHRTGRRPAWCHEPTHLQSVAACKAMRAPRAAGSTARHNVPG